MSEQGQDPRVVLLVVAFLGLISLGGLAGTVFLIHSGTEAASLLAVSSIAGPCVGGLVGILATTRVNPQVQVDKAKAQGYSEAVGDVAALGQVGPA